MVMANHGRDSTGDMQMGAPCENRSAGMMMDVDTLPQCNTFAEEPQAQDRIEESPLDAASHLAMPVEQQEAFCNITPCITKGIEVTGWRTRQARQGLHGKSTQPF